MPETTPSVREAADTIREALNSDGLRRQALAVPAHAALDVLVAAAERAEESEAWVVYKKQLDRAEAAEARADTLEAALRWYDENDTEIPVSVVVGVPGEPRTVRMGEVARAALAAVAAKDTA